MKNPETNTVVKVAIADDHALFRTGVKTSLSARKDIQMVAEAENGMPVSYTHLDVYKRQSKVRTKGIRPDVWLWKTFYRPCKKRN